MVLFLTIFEKTIVKKINKSNVQDIFELNKTQQSILFEYLNDSKGNVYNVQLSLELKGKIHVETFRKAISFLQAENEALRSVFRWDGLSKPIQIVLKQSPVALGFYDISEDADRSFSNFFQEFLIKDQQEHFDLTELPLRINLIQLSSDVYALIITHHHILFDGWSTGIFLTELFAIYNKLVDGIKHVTSTKPKYKTVYGALQEITLKNGDLDFWKEYLRGYDAKSFLKKDNRSAASKKGIIKQSFLLPFKPIEEFAIKHKVTKASILYASFGLLFQKYVNGEDFVFATSVSGRDTTVKGLGEVIGNFINTVPIRFKNVEHNSLLDYIQYVHKELIAINQYVNVPYTKIKQLAGYDAGINLFEVLVVIENYPLEMDMLNSHSSYKVQKNSTYENTNIPLVITVFFNENLEIELSIAEEIFENIDFEMFKTHFQYILNQILKHSSADFKSLCIVSEVEKNELLYSFNNTFVDYPKDATIISMFDNQVQKDPHHAALISAEEGKRLSYLDLDLMSNQVGNYLIDTEGIVKGDFVGIMLEREIYLIAGIFGILKSGAAYIPIDPGFPQSRIDGMIADSGIKVLITRGKYIKGIMSTKVLDLDQCEDQINQSSLKSLSKVLLSGRDLAYIIYTSGSTGKPKGVMISHQSVVNRLKWMQKEFSISTNDVLLQKTPVTFDVSVWELFWWSFNGATLCLLKPGAEKVPLEIVRTVEDHQVTVIHFVPSMLRAFLLVLDDEFYLKKLNSLKFVFSSGESLKGNHVSLFNQRLYHLCGCRLINLYGPTETTVDVSYYECNFEGEKINVPIGKPIDNIQLYVLDKQRRLVPKGVSGELYIGGAGLAIGYLNNEELTKLKFVNNPYKKDDLIYATGDIARWLPDGNIEYQGRIDTQVKIRGVRIELREIEIHLERIPGIIEAIVIVKESADGGNLIAYYITDLHFEDGFIRNQLIEILPAHMIPSYFIPLKKDAVNENGKLDRKALPEPIFSKEKLLSTDLSDIEKKIYKIWVEALGHEIPDINQNFFDVGGDSLKLITISTHLSKIFNKTVHITDLFGHPTIASQSQLFTPAELQTPVKIKEEYNGAFGEIAIIGMSGRFPGASNLEEFWQNLISGTDSIQRKPSDQLEEIVFAKGILEDYDHFDAEFFGYLPDEALSMDPQIRIFHECTWEALEDAGYNPYLFEGGIGLYAGATPNPIYNINVSEEGKHKWINKWEEFTYSDKDFLCSRVSYRLNLKGPSVNISTACSTSLVAIDLACSELLANKCNLAIAGGVSVTLHDNEGYVYKEGMILSTDGICRAFDNEASGTVGGNGVGVVVLKRLEDALRDGDNIHAIIKGSATNNDGNQKVGFTAPSVEGQSNVIKDAIKKAKIHVDTISYIEAHGTGTELGDPIEIAGLSKAFNSSTKNHCAIGSVKTNIGHLDVAAGIAGVIKTVLCLKNKRLVPSLHFNEANEKIDFINSPFYVNTKSLDWNDQGHPRRAGISSFGIGGTNAHIIVEEAPERIVSEESKDIFIIPLSAKNTTSLQLYKEKLVNFLIKNKQVRLADIAYTLQQGRVHFPYREHFVCSSTEELIHNLGKFVWKDEFLLRSGKLMIVYLFSGQGAQYTNMFADLYTKESVFKEIVDTCFSKIKEKSGKDLKTIVFSSKTNTESSFIDQTSYTQPALFVFEYALAKLLMNWGIVPDVMMGHSIGEYVAACLSGIFKLDDALEIVMRRGELMQKTAHGLMLSILISEQDLTSYLDDSLGLSLAAINSSECCVVSGDKEIVLSFKKMMESKGYICKIIRTSHAFHSHLMDDILKEFKSLFAEVKFGKMSIPYISNLTGEEASDLVVGSAEYWVKHLRNEVRFDKGLQGLLAKENVVFLELGPGSALTSFVESNKAKKGHHHAVSLVRNINVEEDDVSFLLNGIGEAWSYGLSLQWQKINNKIEGRRISLPTYAFEKTKYPVKGFQNPIFEKSPLIRNLDVNKWFYRSYWKNTISYPDCISVSQDVTFLIFADEFGLAEALMHKLDEEKIIYIIVKKANAYKKINSRTYEVNPERVADLHILFENLNDIENFIYCWTIDNPTVDQYYPPYCGSYFFLLINIVKSIVDKNHGKKFHFSFITADTHRVHGNEKGDFSLIALVPWLKVAAQEFSEISASYIDIALNEISATNFIDLLWGELKKKNNGKIVAFRNNIRWEQEVEQLYIPTRTANTLRFNGIYLITGGLGNLGFELAKYLLIEYEAKVVLLGRTDIENIKNDINFYENRNTVEKKRRLDELNSLAGETYYFNCDITDKKQVEDVVSEIQSNLGSINGIVHAAGITKGASVDFIDELNIDDYNDQISSKVLGLHRLYEAFSEVQLDFLLLASSISTLIGGIKFAAYAPANMLMNCYHQYLQSRKNMQNWISVNFDGLAFDDDSSNGMKINELHQVFEQLISMGYLSEITVSMGILSERIDQWVYNDLNINDESINVSNRDLSPKSIQSKLSKIWCVFFGKKNIPADVNFFDLGGDSLKALKLIDNIKKELKVQLSLTNFFDNPTIEGINNIISQGVGSPRIENKIERILPNENTAYELSSVQKRLYFLDELNKCSVTYNMPMVLRVSGSLDKIRLLKVFKSLLQRHEMLRTYFESSEDLLVQKVADNVLFEIVNIETEADNLTFELRNFIRPFELSKAPLIRAGIATLEEKEHILIVDIHHIISDGISRNILIRDFMALYSNEKLPELTYQYKDYVKWQQSEEQQNQLQTHKSFWLKQYETPVQELKLPLDFPRPQEKHFTGEEFIIKIGLEEYSALKKVADQEGVTMFMLMFTAYNILISRLGNLNDIVIGVPTSGRYKSEFHGVVGMFVNTIPIRTKFNNNLSFQEFLSQVKQEVLSCIEHESYPYEKLIEELHIKRNTSNNPLFDVMFSYQNYEETTLSIPGLNIEKIELGVVASKFDLTLEVTESAEGLLLRFEYVNSLFKPETIARFASYLDKILSTIRESPEILLSEIDIISEEEIDLLLRKYNDTTGDQRNEKTIIDLFAERAASHPDRIAVSIGEESLTYGELDTRSNQLARFFLKKGVKNEDLIALLLDRSLEMFISIFAVWKSGAAYLILDPHQSTERINFIIKDSNPLFIVTNMDRFSTDISNVLFLNEEDWLAEEQNNLETKIFPTNLAHLVYITDPTGNLNGIMMTHKNISNFLLGVSNEILLVEGGNMFCLSSAFFDIFILEAILPLVNGLRVVLVGMKEMKDRESLIHIISAEKIDYIHIMPSLLSTLIDGEKNLDFLKNVRALIFGKEPLSLELLQKLKQNFPGQIYNLYGTPETTIYSVIQNLTTLDTINNGKPILNTSIYILDDNNKLCPVGVWGKVCIGGMGVVSGYWGNKELTKERFILNPFNSEDVIYETYDIGRWSNEGCIEIFNQFDKLAKIEGYKIDLQEIEHYLQKFNGIGKIITQVVEKKGKKELVAYNTGNNIDKMDAQLFLHQYLPYYMIPDYYIQIDSIPVTSNGEINRKVLSEMDRRQDSMVIVTNTTEEKLKSIWSELLNIPVDSISSDKSFFELGGHSLNASLLISKIRKHFDVEFPLKDLFYRHQICTISEYIITVKQMSSSVDDKDGIILL